MLIDVAFYNCPECGEEWNEKKRQGTSTCPNCGTKEVEPYMVESFEPHEVPKSFDRV